MKTITLDNIEWIESPNWTGGRTDSIKAIVAHWWGDPAQNPKISGVISHFQNSASEVSAHFVVSGDRVVQMVNMANTAWHARQANPYTIGIEIDPNVPGNTYETAGALVKFIRSYYGNIPVKKHSDYVATACPGNIDTGRIESIANGTYNIPAPAPVPTPKPLYKVMKDGKQIGAYSVEENAYNLFFTNKGDAIMFDGKNVTAEIVAKYAPKTAPVDTPMDIETNSIVKQILAILQTLAAKINTIFK